MTRVVTWGLEAIAIGPKGQQMDVQIGLDGEPTEDRVARSKVVLHETVWKAFAEIFEVDPVRVEIHINHKPEEVV